MSNDDLLIELKKRRSVLCDTIEDRLNNRCPLEAKLLNELEDLRHRIEVLEMIKIRERDNGTNR